MKKLRATIIPHTSSGDAGRPIQTSRWTVPAEVWIGSPPGVLAGQTQPAIVWKNTDRDKLAPNTGSHLLEEFTGLENADDETVLKFARKWGPLKVLMPTGRFSDRLIESISEQLLLSTDFEIRGSIEDIEDSLRSRILPRSNGYENLYLWRRWSGLFNIVFRVWKSLDEGELPAAIDLICLGNEVPEQQEYLLDRDALVALVYGTMVDRFQASADKTIQELKGSLMAHLNEWLKLSGVGFTLSPRGSDITLTVMTESVFGALLLQLQAAIATRDGFALCSHCYRPYRPHRQPQSTRRNYCGRKLCLAAANARRSRESWLRNKKRDMNERNL